MNFNLLTNNEQCSLSFHFWYYFLKWKRCILFSTPLSVIYFFNNYMISASSLYWRKTVIPKMNHFRSHCIRKEIWRVNLFLIGASALNYRMRNLLKIYALFLIFPCRISKWFILGTTCLRGTNQVEKVRLRQKATHRFSKNN